MKIGLLALLLTTLGTYGVYWLSHWGQQLACAMNQAARDDQYQEEDMADPKTTPAPAPTQPKQPGTSTTGDADSAPDAQDAATGDTPDTDE